MVGGQNVFFYGLKYKAEVFLYQLLTWSSDQMEISLAIIRTLEELLIEDKLRHVFEKEARIEATRLRTELTQIKALLAVADKHQLVGKKFDDSWSAKIREVAYEAEDLIETYYVESQETKGLPSIFRSSSSHKVAKDLAKLREKIKHLKEIGEIYDLKKKGLSEEEKDLCTNSQMKLGKHPQSRNLNSNSVLVGREEKTAELRNRILDDNGPSRICIIGIGGIGKTTIARKIYESDKIRSNFKAVAWVQVGRNFESASLLRKILEQLDPEIKAEDLKRLTKLAMSERVFDVLRSVRCLLVLDDVWSEDFWDGLRIAFPSGKLESRLLFTSRNTDFPRQTKSDEFVIGPLTDLYSWELFKRHASLDIIGKDKQLNEAAKDAVRLCGGSPLSIIVLGRLLAAKNSPTEWEITLDALKYRLDKGLPKELQMLSLSYDDLSEPLKLCFLYLGFFPEDSNIEVEKLYQLWIAEGFISYDRGGAELTTVDIAEQYFDALISRCLVEVHVAEVPSVRQFKSCRLHDLVRELCLRKGQEQSFCTSTDLVQNEQPEKFSIPSNLRHGKKTDLPAFSYPSIGKPRRLSVSVKEYDNTSNYFIDLETFKHVRSILAFNGSKSREKLMQLPESFNFRLFTLLRVLDLDGFDFEGNRSLKELRKLGFLRYLSFRECHLGELPSSIGELSYLQTLDLQHVRALSVSIPNVLWKLTKLRHLYLPPVYHTSEDDKLRLDSLKVLETLKNFDTAVCNVVDLLFLTNLRVLGVTTEGNSQDLESIVKCINLTSSYMRKASLDIKNFSIYSEERKVALRRLFESVSLHTLRISGHIVALPNITSSSLTKIVFKDSEIVEDPMPTLEKFPNLWVLVLENRAFLGKRMVCSAIGFPQLRTLKISNLDNLEYLMIEQGAMPNLSSLTIQGCKNLEEIHGLGTMAKLSTLTLEDCKCLEKVPGLEAMTRLSTSTPDDKKHLEKILLAGSLSAICGLNKLEILVLGGRTIVKPSLI